MHGRATWELTAASRGELGSRGELEPREANIERERRPNSLSYSAVKGQQGSLRFSSVRTMYHRSGTPVRCPLRAYSWWGRGHTNSQCLSISSDPGLSSAGVAVAVSREELLEAPRRTVLQGSSIHSCLAHLFRRGTMRNLSFDVG